MLVKNTKSSTPSQVTKVENNSSRLSLFVKKHLLAAPKDAKEMEHFWTQLNQNATVSSDQRDALKIRSTTKLVIELAKQLPEGEERDMVAPVLMGLKGKYPKPANYISALRKHLPASISEHLEILETSEAIDSLYRSKI